MAGFSSTVTPVKPPAPPKPKGYNVSGYFGKGGKPTFANSIPVGSLGQTPTGGWNVSGYFNPQGKPTFAASPQVTGLAQTPTGVPPKPPAAPPAAPPASPPALPPWDATAAANSAQNRFNVNNKINGLNSQSSADTLALQNALAQLSYQEPRDQLRLEQGANNRGALYSSVYNQNLGDLNKGYVDKQDAATSNNTQQQASIASQIQALLGGEPLYDQGQSAAAAQRAIAAAAANPATGQAPAVKPPAASTGSSAAQVSNPGHEIQSGGPWVAAPSRPAVIQSGGFRAAPKSKGAISQALKLLGKGR
jgi:hypothetical protein